MKQSAEDVEANREGGGVEEQERERERERERGHDILKSYQPNYPGRCVVTFTTTGCWGVIRWLMLKSLLYNTSTLKTSMQVWGQGDKGDTEPDDPGSGSRDWDWPGHRTHKKRTLGSEVS